MVAKALPVKPLGIWTIKKKWDDQYDKYIVLSFPISTSVLQIGEKVEEVFDSGLENSK